ncbi:MAG: NAD-dependent deacylase [Haliscomenobacteraceae bacterium CHB4]|nr:NAD-dependent protein deacylase [Saprospiraceae bacterium]MCE7921556.1 NAD-dependent deacylase [Haliscomenobacteraceae bacterium CHB4]
MKKIVVLTGAGISAESGIKTFRDSDGLWENHRIEDVATPEGWAKNPGLVLEFYNQRRAQLFEVEPNAGHKALAELEKNFDVHVVTQNVDDLHERAGSSRVLHLHGELRKSRSESYPDLIYACDGDIRLGDKCARGAQLRPHIVWFGEAVPMLEPAAELAAEADIFIIVGTSLQVYPAASLMIYANPRIPFYYVDPRPQVNYELSRMPNLTVLEEAASTGVKKVVEMLESSGQ